MRRFLKKVSLFFIILFVFLVLMNRWMDHESYPHYPMQYDEVFHPTVNADVVILGASHATHGINPNYLESDHLKFFNFALNGAPPSFYVKWYDQLFRHYYRKPSHVIYAVHWVMFDDQFLQRQFEQDSKYFPFRFFIKQFKDLKALPTLIFNRFALTRERKQILSLLFKKRRELFPKEKYYHGFIPFKVRRNLARTEVTHPIINPAQWNAFDTLLNSLERDQIKVIFVQVPGYLYGREDQDIQKNVRVLREIAEKRKIPFLDYETERITGINTNSDLFADWTHFNEKGSEAFSQLLRKDLDGLLK